MKLTSIQLEAINKMSFVEGYNAKDLGINIRTLDSLVLRGLAKRSWHGSHNSNIASPYEDVYFTLTKKAKEFISG